jgi:putative DNA primase/helicase
MMSWKDKLRYFPLKRNAKTPACETWSYDDASLVRNPSMNEGIPCGRSAGVFVLDVDPRHGGDVSLREMEQKHGPLPETYQVGTPGTGTHNYFKYFAQGEDTIPNSAGKIAPGIDIRGDGGYVVAPGSTIDGKAYREVNPDIQPADAPAWLQIAVLGLRKTKTTKSEHAPCNNNGQKIPNGQRNDALVRQAGKLRNMNLSEDGLAKALLDYAQQNFEEMDSNTEPDIREMAARAIADWDAPPPSAQWLPKHRYTPVEIAQRSAVGLKNKVLYVVDDGSWRRLESGLWVENLADCAGDITSYLSSEIPAEPPKETKEEKKLHGAWTDLKGRLQSKHVVTDVRFFLEGNEPSIHTRQERFDADPDIIGLPEGKVLNLTDGTVRLATPEDLLTRALTIAPSERCDESTCPHWLRYLETTQPNENIRSFLKRFFGYALTASDREQVFLFFIGIAGSGKNTMLYPISTIMGRYYVAIGLPLLSIKTDEDRRNNYLADLAGKRLAMVGEMPFSAVLDANILKSITGGEAKLTARRLGHQPFEFAPYFKIVILSNTAPNLSGVDGGIKRRVLVVPFERDFTDAPDVHLREKLQSELPGILRWMVEGCLEWRQTGLCPPAEIRARTDEYLAEADVFEKFLQDVCVEDVNGFAPTSMMFARWKALSKDNNYLAGTETGFAEMVKAKRPKTEQARVRHGSKNPVRGFRGLRLLESEIYCGEIQV